LRTSSWSWPSAGKTGGGSRGERRHGDWREDQAQRAGGESGSKEIRGQEESGGEMTAFWGVSGWSPTVILSVLCEGSERFDLGEAMGQKVHPYGFRLGYTKPWKSRWFVERDYDKLLHEDVKLKTELKEKLKSAGVSTIEIERPGNKLRIIIKTARPGIIIGRKGAEIDKLKGELQKRTSREVFVDIQEVHKPELDAQLVSESIALQLEKRVGFRRAMRKAVDSALRFGCKGIKVRVSGRLNGNEIARSEWYLQGRLPLHTLRADIDYGFTEARTTYGVIGVKCWVYKGEILPAKKREPQTAVAGGF
jgi:small subunit ribosomal protein S3